MDVVCVGRAEQRPHIDTVHVCWMRDVDLHGERMTPDFDKIARETRLRAGNNMLRENRMSAADEIILAALEDAWNAALSDADDVIGRAADDLASGESWSTYAQITLNTYEKVLGLVRSRKIVKE